MAYGPTGGLGLRAEQALPLTGTGTGTEMKSRHLLNVLPQ